MQSLKVMIWGILSAVLGSEWAPPVEDYKACRKTTSGEGE